MCVCVIVVWDFVGRHGCDSMQLSKFTLMWTHSILIQSDFHPLVPNVPLRCTCLKSHINHLVDTQTPWGGWITRDSFHPPLYWFALPFCPSRPPFLSVFWAVSNSTTNSATFYMCPTWRKTRKWWINSRKRKYRIEIIAFSLFSVFFNIVSIADIICFCQLFRSHVTQEHAEVVIDKMRDAKDLAWL